MKLLVFKNIRKQNCTHNFYFGPGGLCCMVAPAAFAFMYGCSLFLPHSLFNNGASSLIWDQVSLNFVSQVRSVQVASSKHCNRTCFQTHSLTEQLFHKYFSCCCGSEAFHQKRNVSLSIVSCCGIIDDSKEPDS